MIVNENLCEKTHEVRRMAPWWWSIYFTMALFLFYLVFPHQMIIFSFYVMLLITGTAVLWHRFPDPLQYEMEWGHLHAYSGDSTSLRMVITNKSFLPFTLIRVIFRVHAGRDKKIYMRQMVIGPFQERYLEIEIDSLRRGVYPLPVLEIRRADLFGMGWIRERWQGNGNIVVFPSFMDLAFEHFPRNIPFGQMKANEKAYEDFSSLSCLREYVPGDPLRRVDWKATARAQKMQVKEYELTATGSFYLIPDINADVHGRDARGERTEELTISAAASVARMSFERNATVSLISAEYWKEHFYTSNRSQCLDYIMSTLARLKLGNRVPAGRILSASLSYLPRCAMIVVITPKLLDDLFLRELYHARYRGCSVMVIWQYDIAGSPGKDEAVISTLERSGIRVVPVLSTQKPE